MAYEVDQEELDAWEAVYDAARALTEADDYEDNTDYEAEAYAEFGSSWVCGGGRAEDVPSAWAFYRSRETDAEAQFAADWVRHGGDPAEAAEAWERWTNPHRAAGPAA
jgi:hypothetical protein